MAGGVFFEEKVTLKSVRERFEQWRKQRERLGPIPADLWAAAAELTKRHTYLEVSKALRVNYNDLKKRARAMQENRVQGEPSHNGFVEVDLVGMGNCAGAEFQPNQGPFYESLMRRFFLQLVLLPGSGTLLQIVIVYAKGV